MKLLVKIFLIIIIPVFIFDSIASYILSTYWILLLFCWEYIQSYNKINVEDILNNVIIPDAPKKKATPKINTDYEFFKSYNLQFDSEAVLEKLTKSIMAFYSKYNISIVPGKKPEAGLKSNVIYFKIPDNQPTNRPIGAKQLQDKIKDLSRFLNGKNVVFDDIVPNSNNVSFTIHSTTNRLVGLGNLFSDKEFKTLLQNKNKFGQLLGLPISLGLNSNGEFVNTDITEAPHVIIAGSTQSGKSLFLKSIVAQLLATHTKETLELTIIDTKLVDFSKFEKIINIIETPEEAKDMLDTLVIDMNNRYQLLKQSNCTNIIDYNKKITKNYNYLPYKVIVIDEYYDLTSSLDKTFNENMIKLVSKARASGIHIILATQRISKDVISGMLRANMPMQIAFKVSTLNESTIVIGQSGAENLSGKGHGLMKYGSDITNFNSYFVSENEINNLIKERK